MSELSREEIKISEQPGPEAGLSFYRKNLGVRNLARLSLKYCTVDSKKTDRNHRSSLTGKYFATVIL
jgi:hypothetical protein